MRVTNKARSELVAPLLQARRLGLDLGLDVITHVQLSDKVDRDWFKQQVRGASAVTRGAPGAECNGTVHKVGVYTSENAAAGQLSGEVWARGGTLLAGARAAAVTLRALAYHKATEAARKVHLARTRL